MGNQNGSAAASKGGVGETLESMEREKERDAQLKRSKSFRRSITKRLGRKKNLGGSRLDEPDGLKPSVAVEAAAAAKKEKKSLAAEEPQPFPAHVQNSFAGDSNNHHHKMNRLRKSLRSSIRRKKGEHKAASDDHKSGGDGGDVSSSSSSNKPHQWQSDEAAVRSGNCTFNVKYLGSVEVFESRGMAVCEEAIKVLKQSKRRSVRSVLHVSGDGLRVVDDETKGLIVDQTIEKVSFCAPDRHYDHGFSYICRDGTTRRWMCHGFIGIKESGERLSHAVGCAFAICLEKKQKRDKECAVSMNFDANTASFTRLGSFRQASITERLQDPQVLKPAPEGPPLEGKVVNPFAIERPHPTDLMLQRQTSFRGLAQLQSNSPFKRQLSLRVSELPSNLQRMKTSSDETSPPSLNCSLSPFFSHHTNLASEEQQPKSIFKMVSSPLPTVPENLPLSENNDAQFSSLSLELLQPEVVHGTDATSNKSISPAPRSKEVANPWDLVPDQPLMNNVNNKANNVSNCDSSSGISSTSSSCVTKPAVAVSSASNINASNNAETTADHSNSWLDQVTESLMTTEPSACHDANDTAVVLEDPFDAEWAALAMRSSSLEQDHHAKNPFLNSRNQKTSSIVQKTFELQM